MKDMEQHDTGFRSYKNENISMWVIEFFLKTHHTI